MAGPSIPTPDILARRRYITNPTKVTISTANNSGLLTAGLWIITSDADCFILQGGSGVVSTSGSSVPLWAKSYAELWVSDDPSAVDTAIAVSAASGSGTLYCFPVS